MAEFHPLPPDEFMKTTEQQSEEDIMATDGTNNEEMIDDCLDFLNAYVEFKETFSRVHVHLLERVFRMANGASDGFLKSKELREFLKFEKDLTEQEIEAFIAEGDFDKDNKLSFREFLFLCQRAELQTIEDIIPSDFSILSDSPVSSTTIRQIFKTLFSCVGIPFRPNIRQSVQFFEMKIAAMAKSAGITPIVQVQSARKLHLPKSTSKELSLASRGSNEDQVFTNSSKDSLIKIPIQTLSIQKLLDEHGNLLKAPAVVSHEELKIQEIKPYQAGDTSCTNQTEDNYVKSTESSEETADVLTPLPKKKQQSVLDENLKTDLNLTEDFWQNILEEERKILEGNPLILPHEYDYDLIIIGSGAGGTAAAKEASKLGKRVAICDFILPSSVIKSWGWRLGGSCIATGCVPKSLIHHSGLIGEALDRQSALSYGWLSSSSSVEETKPEIDWTTLIDHVQSHIKILNEERKLVTGYREGVEYFNAHCKFHGPHSINLTMEDKSTKVITGQKILITVGSLYQFLDIPGAPGNCITIDDIFSLRTHPGKVLIVGGGPDAIECAGLLLSLNLDVTLMSRSLALKNYDQRMATLIMEMLNGRGLNVMIGFSPVKIDEENDSPQGEFTDNSSSPKNRRRTLIVHAKHGSGEIQELKFNTVILAIGKKPCTNMLQLDKAVDDKTGKIWVDSKDMTTSEDVYALGDCATNRPGDTAVSFQAGTVLSQRLFTFNGQPELVMDYDQPIPKFLMTPVEYACIGLSEEAAVAEHGKLSIEVYYSRFKSLQSRFASSRYGDRYYAKLITLKPEDERVIGLHYLGPNAGEVVQGFVLAFKFKATKADFDSMNAIHPTCAEIFSKMSKLDENGTEHEVTNY